MSDIVKKFFLRIFDMSDIAKSFVVLIVSVILVHLAYIGYVRPEADLILEAAKQVGQSTGSKTGRSIDASRLGNCPQRL